MATTFNPFGGVGRGQRGGQTGTGSTGRGRGAHSARGTSSFPPRGASNSRGAKYRGRGRGAGANASRGRGAGTTGAHQSTASGLQANTPPHTNSPFGQFQKKQSPWSTFGQPSQAANINSPFAASAHNTNFGKQGAQKHYLTSSERRKQAAGQPVPVEDSSAMAEYAERYEQLKLDRDRQRKQAIKDGHMADPNQPTSLKQAITPVGTCEDMCPEFEMVQRIVQKMVDKSEKYLHPSTGALQNMEGKMLKRFRRSAAGYDEQLPSDIRTPKALLQSTNYLIRYVLDGPEPLGLIHKFVWDRTRSIRNDFSVQQVTNVSDVKIAVTCLERIARFHIVALHLLSSPANEEPFDSHQEREQLNNTMLSLMYYYDDNRGRIMFPNEAEFRAYYIIFSIHDQRPDLEARVQRWPVYLVRSPPVQVALELYAASCNTWQLQGTLDARRPNAVAQGFYQRFFNIVNSPGVSYLMGCVAEIYFNYVRQTTIRDIWRAYCRMPLSQQHKNDEWTLDELTRVLHFDDDAETILFIEEQGLEFARDEEGRQYVNWGQRHIDSVAFSPSSGHAYSETCVENKRVGRSLVAIILGMSIREAARMGMVDQSLLPQRPSKTPEDTGLEEEGTTAMEDPSILRNPPTSILPNQTAGTETTSIPNPFGTAQPPNSFASTFGAPSQASVAPTPAPAPAASNPFAAAPASTMTNPFGMSVTFVPPALATTNPFAMAKDSKAAAAAQPPNPFSFLKPAGTAPETQTEPKAAKPATEAPKPLFATPVMSNPFGVTKDSQTVGPAQPSASPFTSPKPAEKTPDTQTEGKPAVSATKAPKSLFSTASGSNPFAFAPPSQTASQPASTPSALPQSTSIFANSDAGNTDGQRTPAPNPSASLFAGPNSSDSTPSGPDNVTQPSSQPATSLFTPAKSPLPATETKEPATATTNAAPESARPASVFPATSQPAPANPFSFLAPNTTPQPLQLSSSIGPGISSSNESSSIFDNVKPAGFNGFKKPSMYEAPQGSSNEKSAPQATSALAFDFSKSVPAKPLPQPSLFAPASTGPSPFAPSAFSAPEPLFPPVNASAGPTTDQKTQVLGREKPALPKQPEPIQPQAVATIDNDGNKVPKTQPTTAPKLTEPAQTLTHKHRSQEEPLQLPSAPQSHKRTPDESTVTASSNALEASSSSESSAPVTKWSVAEYYAKELPKLPCLQRAQEVIDRHRRIKQAPAAENKPRREFEIDEHEFLATQARIAAENFRNRPGMFDPPTPEELRRWNSPEFGKPKSKSVSSSSYNPTSLLYLQPKARTPVSETPKRPLYGSLSYGAEMCRSYRDPIEKLTCRMNKGMNIVKRYKASEFSKPSQYLPPALSPASHGYEVAHAPDVAEGLGRSMSASERRIRATGAHGLAYKPLDFSRAKKRKADQQKDKGSKKERKDDEKERE
ncbi:hypothetical protein N7532_006537 [Penicillium argentinense]|uniref:SAC3/GANP/THP3 conserved domain-containing protein n=1 Tax=Penicillium argentinense TaxID=1131581 RepID=A0A9W9FG59_9EURO|nr:uncharacterized protein N7532_006537 [Penicillium argentinense]KAJ5099536.1 hypothetical protein N7532_006537 [Penicillium argentinense]